MAKGRLSQRRLLTPSVLALAALALAPGRFTGWLNWFREPVAFVLAPIAGPAAALSRALRPAKSETLPDDPELASVVKERDVYNSMWLDAERRVGELAARIEELQRGLRYAPEVELRMLFARVVGSSSDPADGLLVVRAGADKGVTRGDTVAVVNGVHMVGRVVNVGPRTCEVLPITRRRAGFIEALIMVDDSGQGRRCQVRGTDDGRLIGDLEDGAADVQAGQTVRLQDREWPEGAQMLVIGRVESVAPKRDAPLRMTVTVRPDLDLSRVQSVVLRIPAEPDAPVEGDGGGGAGAVNWLVFAITTWVIFGLEMGLKDGLALGSTAIAPSFAMVLLTFVAMSAPRQQAIWASLIIGLLLDLTHARPAPGGMQAVTLVGPYAIGALLGGYAVLTMRAMVIRKNVLTIAFLSIVASAMTHVLFTALLSARSWYDGNFVQINALGELGIRLASSLYTGALALVLGPLLMFLAPVFGFPQAAGRRRR